MDMSHVCIIVAQRERYMLIGATTSRIEMCKAEDERSPRSPAFHPFVGQNPDVPQRSYCSGVSGYRSFVALGMVQSKSDENL
jgi:hypothetical protein